MIRTPQNGQEISMAMLDGNGMCKEVLNKFCQSKPQLQLLAILNPTLESLPQAFNTSLASHPPPMTNLDILVLRGCDFLVDIGHIRELSKLTVLEISGASSLAQIPPDIFEKMTKLQSLHLSSLQIEELPASFYKLTELQRLLLKNCPKLHKLGCLEKCDNIVVLNLSGATSLNAFPCKNLEKMPKLRTLDLSNTNISNLIKIGRIEHLTHISLRGCPRVDRIPSIASLPSLQVLDISGAKNFTEIHDKSFANNYALNILDLSGTQIRKLPSSVGNPRHLCLKGCSSLEELSFMESLKNLEALDLSNASNVKIEEKFFESLTKLRLLNLSKTNIESLPYLSNHSELRQLLLSHCSSLYELPQLKNLPKLEVLDLSGCTLLKEIQDESFDRMTCLQKLILSETQFEILPSLSKLVTLRVLLLASCSRLKVLLSLESLSRLEELNLSSVTCLGETGAADFLKDMGHLQILDLSESNLKKLPSMSNLENLSQLLLRGCNQLEEVPDLQHLTKLEVLDVSGTAIRQLPHLQDLVKLKVLDLSGTALSQLPSLNNLTNLHQLLLRDCPNLDPFFQHEIPDQSVKECHWHISNLPEMITDSNRPSTSVSGSTFLKLLEKNLSVRQLLEKSPSLRETGLKQFHLSVRPVDKQNSGGIHCCGDVRGIYFQARCFPYFDEQGISLELCGFHDFPQGIDDVLSSAEYVFLFDNIFIKELYDLGAQNIKHMKGCWIERCENMQSVFHSKEEGDISKLWKNLEILWLSNLHNLTSIYSGNLQHQGLRSLKLLYLDCCPRLSSLFSSSHLPKNLEILQIKFCDNLETVVENSTSEDCALPKLCKLILFGLPKLKSIGAALPSLQDCNRIVRDCPQLQSEF
ncbi:hypothetical protein Vadar_000509 [Vaccinium darrowii]|uniref:Uncharacterized protein n=1 Tax=Vaccinium darrowii TaxID=229202 RepID=A0ACB7XVQ2_9ERIC|nr:hypothetical protein Vadar_000509 [Vaccinium darrowii]